MGKTNESSKNLISIWDAPSDKYNLVEKLGLWLCGFKYELEESDVLPPY